MKHQEDIRHYSEDELSLRVMNDEYLYRVRNELGLESLLQELYVYTDRQFTVLQTDIMADEDGRLEASKVFDVTKLERNV